MPPPLGLTTDVHPQACRTLSLSANTDVSGGDIPCNSESFCKVCGGVDAVRAACGGASRCTAFTMDLATGCGYLKTGSGSSVTRAGFAAFLP